MGNLSISQENCTIALTNIWHNLVFVYLLAFAHVEVEKMKLEVILPWTEIKGEIAKYFSYQTLSLYKLDNVLTTAATFHQNYAPLFHFIPGLRKELRDYLLAFKHFPSFFLIGS